MLTLTLTVVVVTVFVVGWRTTEIAVVTPYVVT